MSDDPLSSDDLDELRFWWASFGPKTAAGDRALVADPVGTQARWDDARRRLTASGLRAFELDNTFDRLDYTVAGNDSERIPAEQAYPADAAAIGAVLNGAPQVRARRAARGSGPHDT